jgi:hypothetical protein
MVLASPARASTILSHALYLLIDLSLELIKQTDLARRCDSAPSLEFVSLCLRHTVLCTSTQC